MTLKVRKGNLFDPAHNFDAIAQGVNCIGVMDAGIAKTFKTKYPLMFNEYKEECNHYSDVILGTVQVSSMDAEEDDSLCEVYNLFTQFLPGNNATYDALTKSVYLLSKHVEQFDEQQRLTRPLRIGLPWIGCGIGGLEIPFVYPILERFLLPSIAKFVIIEL